MAGENIYPEVAAGAVDLVYARTVEVPRLVNKLCDICLVYASTEEKKTIGREIVNEVIRNGIFPSCQDVMKGASQ